MLNEFQDFCRTTFQLMPADLVMIPVSAVLFYGFWKAMERQVFRPFLSLQDQRERALQEPVTQASEYETQAAQLDNEFEKKYRQARLEAADKKKAALQVAKQEASNNISQAREQAQEILSGARGELQQQADTLRSKLSQETAHFVRAIVDRVLSTPSGQ